MTKNAPCAEQHGTVANCAALPAASRLIDRFGRVHRSLRISVTDVCNIRCQYCMPAEDAEFLPEQNLLSFEAIERFVRFVSSCGVSRLRLTGGEPLLRKQLAQLVGRLHAIPTVDDIALTTNGILLPKYIDDLAAAGLKRVNISLDTLEESVFQRISRRSGLARVLDGIQAAHEHPGIDVKLNALVLRQVNLEGVLELVEFAASRKIPLRFIEFMPLDAERAWNKERMVSGDELRERITQQFGTLRKLDPKDPARPAQDYRLDGKYAGAVLGFIDSVSKPFCAGCDRLRLTADGKIRNCLFGQQEWDVSHLLEGDPK